MNMISIIIMMVITIILPIKHPCIALRIALNSLSRSFMSFSVGFSAQRYERILNDWVSRRFFVGGTPLVYNMCA